jgi:hypothetical protein
MRPLFKSESRLLQRLLLSCWNVTPGSLPNVRHEILINSGSVPRFNDDFTLEFRDRPFPERIMAGTRPALPDTIGPAINVLVEANTFEPLLLELMFGDSLNSSCYQRFADLAQQKCRALVAEAVELQSDVRRAVETLVIAHAPFARVLVADGDLCLLIGTADADPVEWAQRHNLTESLTEDIDICVSPDGAVWIDGWMATRSESRPDKLVAIPDVEE